MEQSTIKSKALSGIIWKLMERIGAQTVSLIVSIVIARILNPTDYKVVALVTIFFTFANILISGGLNTALIQKKDSDIEDYSTVLHVSVILSLAIYAALFFAAPYIADIYNEDALIAIIRIMGLSLPVTAVKSIWCAYISANLQFKKFFFATIGGTVFSAFVGIILALKGAGAWALVAQQMSNTFIDTIILIATTRIRIVFRISAKKLRTLFSYGWKVFVSSFIGTVYTQIVPLVIGVKYTDADLSYYTKGKNFPELISSTATNTLSAVLFPTLAKFQDDKNILLRYTRLFIRTASFIAFPLMLGFLAVSDNFITVVLTEKWLPAAPYIKIFCVANMFEMIHVGNCETVKAMGRSDVYLIMEVIKKTGYFVTIALFLWLTNTPVSLALAFIVCTVIAIIVNMIPNRKMIGYKFRYQIMDLLPNLATSGIMCICTILAGRLKANALLVLILQIVIGVAVYVVLNIIIKNPNLAYIWGFVKNKLKGTKHE